MISRTSLPCLLEDIRNPLWLNKLLESRYDEDQMVVNSTSDYTPVAELMGTGNKVFSLDLLCGQWSL